MDKGIIQNIIVFKNSHNIVDDRINEENLKKWFSQSIINGNDIQTLYEEDWKNSINQDNFYKENLLFLIANIIYNENEGSWQVPVIEKWLKDFVPLGSYILDYGAGSGYIGQLVYQMGYDSYTYLDLPGIAKDFAEEVTIGKNLDYINPYEQINRKFDCIICLDVLEHIDAFKTFERITGLLETGGVLMLNYCFHPEHNVTHLPEYSLEAKKKLEKKINEYYTIKAESGNLKLLGKK